MTTVKIFGAGSIGNHLANAARVKGWGVTICDLDQNALSRTRNDIYPTRYGKFDEESKSQFLVLIDETLSFPKSKSISINFFKINLTLLSVGNKLI